MDNRTHDEFIAFIKLPYGSIRSAQLVEAVNIAIQEIAKRDSIDLGGSMNWDLKIYQNYDWVVGNEYARATCIHHRHTIR